MESLYIEATIDLSNHHNSISQEKSLICNEKRRKWKWRLRSHGERSSKRKIPKNRVNSIHMCENLVFLCWLQDLKLKAELQIRSSRTETLIGTVCKGFDFHWRGRPWLVERSISWKSNTCKEVRVCAVLKGWSRRFEIESQSFEVTQIWSDLTFVDLIKFWLVWKTFLKGWRGAWGRTCLIWWIKNMLKIQICWNGSKKERMDISRRFESNANCFVQNGRCMLPETHFDRFWKQLNFKNAVCRDAQLAIHIVDWACWLSRLTGLHGPISAWHLADFCGLRNGSIWLEVDWLKWTKHKLPRGTLVATKILLWLKLHLPGVRNHDLLQINHDPCH